MLIYHTSLTVVDKPDTKHSRRCLDFGAGFYATRLKEQAVKYAQRFNRLSPTAYLCTYEYTPCDSLKVKTFEAYDEEWLLFVCDCRKGGTSYKEYDIIEGGVANDKVFRSVDLFIAGENSMEFTLKKLAFEKPNHQLCFITQTAIECSLRFVDYQIVKTNGEG